MAVVLPCKPATSSILIVSSLFFFYFLFVTYPCIRFPTVYVSRKRTEASTSLHHIVFGIAASARSWPRRSDYVRLWWTPGLTRGFVFLDRLPDPFPKGDLPPIRISEDTSRFPYTFPRGLRSAIRVARIIEEIVRLDLPDVRWIVLGDDDTVFVPYNLALVLSKYDHKDWFYIGANSESVEQNLKYSFDMAFGGGGFAVSYPLARALANVLDSCLMRYAHLYGSDARVYSCLAELGVGLTRELGFHQVDVRGDIFGMLSSHPLAPLISLHHLDNLEPVFPNMNHTQALEHLFKAIKVDPSQILQKTVCYDNLNSLTISVSWGYSVQVYEGNILLPDLLPLQKSFTPWKRGRDISSSQYMFNSREFPSNPCLHLATFFLERVFSDLTVTHSKYKRHNARNCLQTSSSRIKHKYVEVSSQKLVFDVKQAQRRHCCDVLKPSSREHLRVHIRECKREELIFMHQLHLITNEAYQAFLEKPTMGCIEITFT
ncbi:hypothetical protein H6P81_007121 [Aristolochia fimbriata]|uniref:Uncharacterized protein n=1 Tax=Aristolochia fimbriata TaxID=158543 RepID=A0AAV7F345_ARIFI|nr:hypothetical protein H6P81_007121 [Aristolochia fimbriata]